MSCFDPQLQNLDPESDSSRLRRPFPLIAGRDRRSPARLAFRTAPRRLVLAAFLSVVLAAVSFLPARAQKLHKADYEIKIATIAPEGSTWMNVMNELDGEIRTATAGRVGLRFYPGGIQGDESIVLSKIRSGQLQGGGFTGVGLGQIYPTLRVLELPFLFRHEDEVAAVHAAMDSTFDAGLHQAGFTLLGWADVGFVYLYSKEPVATTADLRRQKVWLWEGDPLAEAFLKAAGVSPVPLAVTDVVTALQTGLITTVYTTPLAVIALQWFTRVSYTTDIPITFSIGAIVMTNAAWDKIPAQDQPVVRDLARKYFARLREATTADNRKSMGVVAQSGVKAVTPTADEIASFRQIGEQVRSGLVGKLFDQATLDQVVAALNAYRSGHPEESPVR